MNDQKNPYNNRMKAAPPEPETFILKNGAPVTIRPIRPDDAPRLQALLARLSPESIFYRFLEYLKSLTPEQAEELANVDYQTRMALVAALEVQGQEQVIAVARYSTVAPDHPETAEVGVVVEDIYQNQGLGSRLLDLLTIYARDHGIRFFTGAISAQNARILRFIRRSGLPTERRLDQGMWEVEVKIDDG
jgi:RimJ/RimL family protein N-acetyltransferase